MSGIRDWSISFFIILIVVLVTFPQLDGPRMLAKFVKAYNAEMMKP